MSEDASVDGDILFEVETPLGFRVRMKSNAEFVLFQSDWMMRDFWLRLTELEQLRKG